LLLIYCTVYVNAVKKLKLTPLHTDTIHNYFSPRDATTVVPSGIKY